ncbi:hypothetical protein ABPG77_001099 [Micractinium sp. CCAP 211/92]
MQREEGPFWLALPGDERLEKEFGALTRDVKAGKLPGVTKVLLPDDDLRCWRIKVEWLDPLTQAGMQFNTDMERTRLEHGPGQASLQLEVSFGEAYPAEPFSMRIVRPRVKPFTVHVTEGGSVCLEALASRGGEDGWDPSRTVGGILQQLLRDFVAPPEPSRGDGYSLREAQDSFRRAAWKRGWVPTPPPAVVEPQDALSWLAFLPELPPSWELSETLLAGQTTYVELPLPGQPGPPCSPRQAMALADAEHVLRLVNAAPPGNAQVVRIERVQNLELRREEVERESKLRDVQLFHGSSREALELICRAGFDVRLAKPNGSLGAGLYFGTSSVTSSSYCCKMFDRSAVNALGHRPAELLPAPVAPEGTAPRFHPGGFSMLLCRVAVGRAGSGQPGARAPQPGCHSAASHNTMHVVYRSDQAYPEYLIHFKRTWF